MSKFLQGDTGAYSVKWAKAMGDNSTIDTAAIRRAITFAKGRPILFPKGIYLIDDEIDMSVSCIGQPGSVIVQTVNNKDAFRITTDNVTIDGIKFTGFYAGGAFDTFTKNNGIYGLGANFLTIKNCQFTNHQYSCIHVRNCNFVTITNNKCYGNYYAITNSSDIQFYSDQLTTGAIITENFCLSNNSQGIWFNALGYDTGGTISDNVCVTMDNDGITPMTMPDLVRRHGIETSYLTGSVFSLSITGNICSNTRLTGIYAQSGQEPSGSISIIGNVCGDNGWETGGEGTLSGGIFVNQTGGLATVTGNSIYNFRNEFNGAITISGSVEPGEVRTTVADGCVTDNAILNSAGIGIRVQGTLFQYLVANNKINNSGFQDIYYLPFSSAYAGDRGGIKIDGNVIVRKNTDYHSIFLDNLSDVDNIPLEIVNNTISGADKSVNAVTNSAIYCQQAFYKIKGNRIRNFYYGVFMYNTITSDGKYDGMLVDNNDFSDVEKAIVLRAETGSYPVCVLQNNTFKDVTSPADGGGYASAGFLGTKYNGTYIFYNNTYPTTGAWLRGDTVMNTHATVPSTTYGWRCITAGTPGTWQAFNGGDVGVESLELYDSIIGNIGLNQKLFKISLGTRSDNQQPTFSMYNKIHANINERWWIQDLQGSKLAFRCIDDSSNTNSWLEVDRTDGLPTLGTFGMPIKTPAPTTGTAAAWKLGSKVDATTTLDTTKYVEIDIGGTLYKLALVTT